jgi:hypothetical protein
MAATALRSWERWINFTNGVGRTRARLVGIAIALLVSVWSGKPAARYSRAPSAAR